MYTSVKAIMIIRPSEYLNKDSIYNCKHQKSLNKKRKT